MTEEGVKQGNLRETRGNPAQIKTQIKFYQYFCQILTLSKSLIIC
jgi:hypothetical protein